MLTEAISSVEGRTILFVRTKRSAEWLSRRLHRDLSVPTSSIHGDRTQREREAALAAFKAGTIRVLVATDVASRGLDGTV